jgi:non-heme chloroperoxidase
MHSCLLGLTHQYPKPDFSTTRRRGKPPHADLPHSSNAKLDSILHFSYVCLVCRGVWDVYGKIWGNSVQASHIMLTKSTKGKRMSYLTTKDQAKIYYNDLGKGEPVILIHGWPVNSDMWEYQSLALLEKGFRVIAYDRRGFGKSSQPFTGYIYDTMADDLKELIDRLDLPVQQKVRLVGFSMGGGEIARYLSRHGSARVAQTVLVSSVCPYMLKTDDNANGVPEKAFADMISGLKEDRPHFLAGFNKDFYGVGAISHPVSEEILRWTSLMALHGSPKATVDCVTAFGKTDFRPDMKAFAGVPTLIIHGTADKTVPIATASEQAAKMIPHAIFKRYEGAPHGLFVTHKNRLVEDLLDFLK